MNVEHNRIYLIISITIITITRILNSTGLLLYVNVSSSNTMRVIVWVLLLLNVYFYIKLYWSVYYNNCYKMNMMGKAAIRGIAVLVFSLFYPGNIALILCIALIVQSIKHSKIIRQH